MAIPKGKTRITITLHNETFDLMNELLSLHDNEFSKSNLVEIALLFYSKACVEQLKQLEEKKEEA